MPKLISLNVAFRFVNNDIRVPVCITDVVAVSPYSDNTSGERLLQRRRCSGVDVEAHELESGVCGSWKLQ